MTPMISGSSFTVNPLGVPCNKNNKLSKAITESMAKNVYKRYTYIVYK